MFELMQGPRAYHHDCVVWHGVEFEAWGDQWVRVSSLGGCDSRIVAELLSGPWRRIPMDSSTGRAISQEGIALAKM